MSRVFLCHNSKDEQAVGHLRRRLKDNGVDAWVDTSEIKGGARWQEELAKALVGASAVVVCLGRHGVGPWQKEEIDLALDTAKASPMAIIPLILPTCGETTPEIPLWLRAFHRVNLREDKTNIDPFGHVLAAIDSRHPEGHWRPTVVILANPEEPSSREARTRVVNNGLGRLRRVRLIDPNDSSLKDNLGTALRHCDLLLTLLDADSHTPRRVEPFQDGVAPGAKKLAAQAGVDVIQWRSDTLKIPDAHADRFRSGDTDTDMPSLLARDVAEMIEDRFHQRVVERAIADNRAGAAAAKPRAVLGYPYNESAFVRSVADRLENGGVDCDSPPKWDRVLRLVKKVPPLHDAFVIVLSRDIDWLSECFDALMEFLETSEHRLPKVSAYLHMTEDKRRADPIPIRLKNFEEYYGEKDIPRLIENIVANGKRHDG